MEIKVPNFVERVERLRFRTIQELEQKYGVNFVELSDKLGVLSFGKNFDIEHVVEILGFTRESEEYTSIYYRVNMNGLKFVLELRKSGVTFFKDKSDIFDFFERIKKGNKSCLGIEFFDLEDGLIYYI